MSKQLNMLRVRRQLFYEVKLNKCTFPINLFKIILRFLVNRIILRLILLEIFNEGLKFYKILIEI